MPYRTELLPEDGIIFTVYTAPYSEEQWAPHVSEALQLAAANGCLLFLGDCRALPQEESSPFDVYQLVEVLDSLGVDHRAREALVVPPAPGSLSTFDFFVTATSNRGIVVRVFLDMDDARKWLLEEKVAMLESLDRHPPFAATLRDTTE